VISFQFINDIKTSENSIDSSWQLQS